jgi:hypothetical protein
MAKAKSDIILRDRLQFTLGAAGDLSLVYGRIDLSDYVNVVERKGLLVKDIFIQIRNPSDAEGGLANTGIWSIVITNAQGGVGTDIANAFKLFVSTRAYENAQDVGIASPDVLHIEEYTLGRYSGDLPGAMSTNWTHEFYPMRDYHPGGYPVVSDLLVGIAVDMDPTDGAWANATLEVDIMLIAETTTVTQDQMTQLLTQAQDL